MRVMSISPIRWVPLGSPDKNIYFHNTRATSYLDFTFCYFLFSSSSLFFFFFSLLVTDEAKRGEVTERLEGRIVNL